MPDNEFKVVSTQSVSYIDEGGALVNGFKVLFRLTQFNETHSVNVPSLDPSAVKAAVMAVLTARKALANL